jgi:hypothetical protein
VMFATASVNRITPCALPVKPYIDASRAIEVNEHAHLRVGSRIDDPLISAVHEGAIRGHEFVDAFVGDSFSFLNG